MALIARREIERRVRRGAAEGINDCIEALVAEAIREEPVDTGLMRSRTTVSKRARDRDLNAEMVVDTPHAAAQHEGMAHQTRGGKGVTLVFRHHPRGGKKKFVEDPLKAQSRRYEEIIARRVRGALAR